MSKRDKRIKRLRQNQKNVTFKAIETILLSLGFESRPGKGSHVVFTCGKHILTVPFNRPFLKSYIVQQVLQVLDELED